MKKTILITFLLFSSIIFSQEKMGIIIGANVNQTNEGFLSGLDTFGFGFHFGATSNFKITENIHFSPKVLFSTQGDSSETNKEYYRGKWSWGTGSGGLDYKLSYLNMPLNFKFFNKTYIVFGPQIGILLSTKKLNLDFGTVENKIDFGINIGIGQKINNFFIELNINQGLSTLITHNGVENASSSFKAKNLVAQLSLGYYLK